MINFLTKSLSLEIVNFLSFLKRKEIPQKSFSKSAFVQARKKIKPEVFHYLNEKLTEEFYTDNSAVKTRFSGKRILSVDGSRLVLPKTKELEKIYGKTKNQTETYSVQAKACVVYDVLNKIAIGGILSSVDTDERIQAKELFKYCRKGDLIIYDRGFASFDFIYEHQQAGLDFVMRVRLDFNQVIKDFVLRGNYSEIVDMYPWKNSDLRTKNYDKLTCIKVRLVRVILPGGEIEVLATSLQNEKQYAVEIFKELYFERWKIETFYDELKNKLRIEEFSGYSNQSILQDFYSTLLVSNIQSLIIEELNEELKEKQGSKKYCYKINTSLSYGFFKNRILDLLFSKRDISEAMDEYKTLLKSHIVPIRPARSHQRNTAKYKARAKPIITKNHKDSL
ncbi:hypothetical protein IW22_20200 [Chryseobacterium sp. JM1]|nr:hypothetical protein IW22_20200 [Chryseobacterium sp. JM1]